MRIHEIRALSSEDIRKELESSHRELWSVRSRLVTRQFSDSSQLKKVRRKIARITTVMRERELRETRP
ncbi:MAG: 50S ribosomal protein L29 [Chloroflexi bacterium]|nr:50S ribosomal protein L29 [Chloroflexota bacterium]